MQFNMAAAHDVQAFYKQELHFRQAMRYPPFSALANILLRSEKQEDALRMSSEIAHLLTPPPENIKVIGPAEAAVPRLKNEFRYQLADQSQGPSSVKHDSARAEVVRAATQVERDSARH